MTQKFTHKGYTLTQTDYNYHYMIFNSDGHMVMHVPYSKQIISDAIRKTGIKNIWKCIHGERKTVGGYGWEELL